MVNELSQHAAHSEDSSHQRFTCRCVFFLMTKLNFFILSLLICVCRYLGASWSLMTDAQ